MNNSEIGAAFVAMCNGTTKNYKTINGRNHLSVHVIDGLLALYSYSTPIAVFDGKKVVINCTHLSASTAKHQNTIGGLCVPTAFVYNFGGFCGNCYGVESSAAYTCRELLEQAAPMYSVERVVYYSGKLANGKRYLSADYDYSGHGKKLVRYVLLKKQTTQYGDTIEIHRYKSEQAAKDEMSRLNRLAVAAA